MGRTPGCGTGCHADRTWQSVGCKCRGRRAHSRGRKRQRHSNPVTRRGHGGCGRSEILRRCRRRAKGRDLALWPRLDVLFYARTFGCGRIDHPVEFTVAIGRGQNFHGAGDRQLPCAETCRRCTPCGVEIDGTGSRYFPTWRLQRRHRFGRRGRCYTGRTSRNLKNLIHRLVRGWQTGRAFCRRPDRQRHARAWRQEPLCDLPGRLHTRASGRNSPRCRQRHAVRASGAKLHRRIAFVCA